MKFQWIFGSIGVKNYFFHCRRRWGSPPEANHLRALLRRGYVASCKLHEATASCSIVRGNSLAIDFARLLASHFVSFARGYYSLAFLYLEKVSKFLMSFWLCSLRQWTLWPPLRGAITSASKGVLTVEFNLDFMDQSSHLLRVTATIEETSYLVVARISWEKL